MARKTQIPPASPLRKGGIPDAPRTASFNEYEHHLKPLARRLRSHQTEAEERLWHHLRRDQLGVRFYRQRPLGPYILDFYAPKAKLVVELDGSQHYDDPAQQRKDARRDAWLNAQGIQILRFDDRQALTETGSVLEVIFQAVRNEAAAEIPPIPPLEKGGVENPSGDTEGSLPFVKGGQAGFDGAPHPDYTTG